MSTQTADHPTEHRSPRNKGTRAQKRADQRGSRSQARFAWYVDKEGNRGRAWVESDMHRDYLAKAMEWVFDPLHVVEKQ